MTARACPDWPMLMEVAPALQFKHYTLGEAKLPAEVLMQLRDITLSAFVICCDLDRHVYHAAHTLPEVAEALSQSHWFEVREWATIGPGAAA